jgi:hypothetical protein
MKVLRWFACFVMVWALATPVALARVVRVKVASRKLVMGGEAFGKAGAYERITGKVYFAVAVNNPYNRRIVDLKNAVNLKHGEVAFSADFVAIRPVDAAKGNGSMLLEVPNRGHQAIVSIVDGGTPNLSNVGDAWLLRRGFTVAVVGWQWDAPGRHGLRLYAPIAKDDGKTIHGLLRGDLMLSRPHKVIPLGHDIVGTIGGTEYPVSDPNDPRNVLTVRDTRHGRRVVIPRKDWEFAKLVDGKVVPDRRHIYLKTGFKKGKIYEYVYAVQDPVVAGLGFASIRDFASWAKHDPHALTPVKRVYGEGISQNGRYLRDFLYQGFNADEQGRMALDGVLAHVAGAGRGSFNYRFAQPSRDAEPTSSVDYPIDIFPFTDEPEVDPVTGERAGLMDTVKAEHVMPKVFLSCTSYEYWGRAAGLITITADGKRDMPIGRDVRVYHFTGLQHFSGPFPPQRGTRDLMGQQPMSPLPIQYFWRAMITNMDAWVRSGELPPPSSYPRIDNGTLVPLAQWTFPKIPGIHVPTEANRGWRVDFGPHWQQTGILSWQPPKVGKPFPALVPAVNADGNEMDGVRLPEITVPLATYTGWNLRDPSIGAPGQRVPFEGSYIPFPKTKADRLRTGDPRLSIAERYSSEAEYLKLYEAALDKLIAERWILPGDKAAMMARGKAEWVLATE